MGLSLLHPASWLDQLREHLHTGVLEMPSEVEVNSSKVAAEMGERAADEVRPAAGETARLALSTMAGYPVTAEVVDAHVRVFQYKVAELAVASETAQRKGLISDSLADAEPAHFSSLVHTYWAQFLTLSSRFGLPKRSVIARVPVLHKTASDFDALAAKSPDKRLGVVRRLALKPTVELKAPEPIVDLTDDLELDVETADERTTDQIAFDAFFAIKTSHRRAAERATPDGTTRGLGGRELGHVLLG